PIGLYRIQRGQMSLGDVKISAPGPLMGAPALWTIWITFGLFACAWLFKTAHEMRRGTVLLPKTVLIAATVVCSIVVPLAATGERLGLAFHSLNAWHSVQSLGLVWIATHEARRARAAAGVVDGANAKDRHGVKGSRPTLVARLSGAHEASWFYLGNLAVTLL